MSRWIWLKIGRVYWRMDDYTFPSIDPLNPFLNLAADGNEMINSLGSRPIPTA